MTNEELLKIAYTRELTDERVAIASAYWLDASPHEQTTADGVILARYARHAMKLLAEKDAAIGSYEHNRKLYQKENAELRKALEEDRIALKDIRTFIKSGWHETAQARIDSALKRTGEGNE